MRYTKEIFLGGVSKKRRRRRREKKGEQWKGGFLKSELSLTYLSNIGLKLMPLSVAICYFYCLWVSIIFTGVRTSSGANFNFYAATRAMREGGLRFQRSTLIYLCSDFAITISVHSFSSRARFFFFFARKREFNVVTT